MAEEENQVKQINEKDDNKIEDLTKSAELEDKSIKDNSAEAKSDVKDESEVIDEKEDKSEEDENEDEEDDEDEGETLPPGLLEQPLEVEGKRQKKKVERLSATMIRSPPEKPQIEIEEGLGTKLGDIPYVAHYVNVTKATDLKSLHKLLFFKAGTINEIKKNIRKFSGTTEAKDSKEREKRLAIANKMSLTELKTINSWLGLKQGGTKADLIGRAMEFFEKPTDQGHEIKKKRKSKSEEKKGVKRKRKTKKTNKEDKQKKKTKKAKKPKTEKIEDEEEDEEDEAEEDPEEEEDLEEDGDSEDDKYAEEEDSEEEAPKKKKQKMEVLKKEKKTPKKAVKENGKEKGTPKKEKQTPKKKSSPAKKEIKKKNTPKKETAELSDSLSDDSDSEEEPLVKAVKPPSNEEIKRVVKDILDGADLETVTMKTVVKQVYAKYPKFDLSDRKDFIKSTVREVIS